MAKRIKIKNNTQGYGFSKADRKISMALGGRPGALGGTFAGRKSTLRTVKKRLPDGRIQIEKTPIGDRNPMSRPSSTRKKLVREGSRKFIGPRSFRSERAEDVDSREREAHVNPAKYITQERGPGRRGEIYEVDRTQGRKGGVMPFEASRRQMRELRRLIKEGPSGRKRAFAILNRIMDRLDKSGSRNQIEDRFWNLSNRNSQEFYAMD